MEAKSKDEFDNLLINVTQIESIKTTLEESGSKTQAEKNELIGNANDFLLKAKASISKISMYGSFYNRTDSRNIELISKRYKDAFDFFKKFKSTSNNKEGEFIKKQTFSSARSNNDEQVVSSKAKHKVKARSASRYSPMKTDNAKSSKESNLENKTKIRDSNTDQVVSIINSKMPINSVQTQKSAIKKVSNITSKALDSGLRHQSSASANATPKCNPKNGLFLNPTSSKKDDQLSISDFIKKAKNLKIRLIQDNELLPLNSEFCRMSVKDLEF